MDELFCDVLVGVKTKKHAMDFVQDFFTPTEQIMFPKRLVVAYLLYKGYDYRSICSVARVSPTTVNKVNTAIKKGGSGYGQVFDRLMKNEAIREVFTLLDEAMARMMLIPGESITPSLRKKKQIMRAIKKERQRKKPF
jgi:uncharacterized protein YerC